MVFAHVHCGGGPLTQQAIGSRRRRAVIRLLHRPGPQRLVELKAPRIQVEILPDQAGIGPTQLKQLGRWRGQTAAHLHRAARRGHRRQALAVDEVAAHPAALHRHRRAIGQQQRRHDEEARPGIHLAVVQVDGVLAQPTALQHDAPVMLLRGCVSIARQIGLRQRRQRGPLLGLGLQRQLLRSPVQLPEAQPGGEQQAQQRGDPQQRDRSRRPRHRHTRPRHR